MTIDVEYTRLRLELVQSKQIESGGQAIVDAVRVLGLHEQPQEALWVIAFNDSGCLYRIVEVARGSHNGLNLDIPDVLKAVLAVGASRFAIAHNHPTRNAMPSASDYDMTIKVAQAANLCGLFLDDHVIVEPGGDFYSYADAKMLQDIPRRRAGPKAASRRKR